jgi:uncharacterized protein with NRDE domain
VCTIITLFQVHPAFPLVIAANRDERYDRPSTGPALLERPRALVAGRDLRAGGTWFGINPAGVAVAVADQGLGDDAPPPESETRSRGLLVLDALAQPCVGAVSRLLAAEPPERYRPFSLLHADTRRATIGHHVIGPVTLRALEPGLDVMVSAVGADHAAYRTAYVRRALDPERLAALPAPALVAALQAVLQHHAAAGGPDDALCRHRAEAGTRSSFVALLAPRLGDSQLHCALGPPCQAPYADYSHLARALASSREE